MRLSTRTALSLGLAAACLTPLAAAHAQLMREYAGRSIAKSPSQIEYAYVRDLRSLRNVMRAQQKADGGHLTPEHMSTFQRSLDKINASRDKTLYNNNPTIVDANGSPNDHVDIHKNWTYAPPVLTGIVP